MSGKAGQAPIVSTFGGEFGPEWNALDMPRKCPDEFRARAVSLVPSGQTVTKAAGDLGITDACLYGWVKQDRIDRGEIEGVSRAEFRELGKAKRRIRELEDEVEILRRANALLGSAAQHQQGSTR